MSNPIYPFPQVGKKSKVYEKAYLEEKKYLAKYPKRDFKAEGYIVNEFKRTKQRGFNLSKKKNKPLDIEVGR